MLPWVAAASTNRDQHAPSSHRNMRRWREVKSVSICASDARYAALSLTGRRAILPVAGFTPAPSANGAIFSAQPERRDWRFQALPKRQRRGIPQPSPTGWVNGQPAMHEPCKGGIRYVAPQCHSSPRKARCWREAKSASSFAKDTRCDAFNRSTADTCAANSRWRGSGGTSMSAPCNLPLETLWHRTSVACKLLKIVSSLAGR